MRQPAWLARVQQRLYRFLLSLYGSGHWRASARSGEEIEVPPDARALTMFEAPEVLPLAGKPAKETGKIRAVLKSVAAAQDQPLAAGPLLAGLPAQYWVAVAVVKRGVDPTACVKLLRSRGLTVRVSNRGTTRPLKFSNGGASRGHQAASGPAAPADLSQASCGGAHSGSRVLDPVCDRVCTRACRRRAVSHRSGLSSCIPRRAFPPKPCSMHWLCSRRSSR